MSNFFKLIGAFTTVILISIVINYSASFLGSSFINDFLSNEYFTVLLTLLGFNIAIQTIVLGQLLSIETAMKKIGHFKNTRSELKQNIYLNFSSVLFSIPLLLMKASTNEFLLTNMVIINTLLLSIFVLALFLLFETLSSAYKMLELKI